MTYNIPPPYLSGIICGDQCKCEYNARGEAGCHCPNKYIIILAVLLVGVVLSGTCYYVLLFVFGKPVLKNS